jgi:hypothetical protein
VPALVGVDSNSVILQNCFSAHSRSLPSSAGGSHMSLPNAWLSHTGSLLVKYMLPTCVPHAFAGRPTKAAGSAYGHSLCAPAHAKTQPVGLPGLPSHASSETCAASLRQAGVPPVHGRAVGGRALPHCMRRRVHCVSEPATEEVVYTQALPGAAGV